ncbi:MAG: hypothetical protein C5B58_08625 [Acidobacteria bacterium]|nr:MAG: hypothetical protein C5B58_08625 [Acidobacteriota bacterium]
MASAIALKHAQVHRPQSLDTLRRINRHQTLPLLADKAFQKSARNVAADNTGRQGGARAEVKFAAAGECAESAEPKSRHAVSLYGLQGETHDCLRQLKIGARRGGVSATRRRADTGRATRIARGRLTTEPQCATRLNQLQFSELAGTFP